ncbi:MAG: hypothetical protein Q4C01_04575 [Clostridia bacterium]|nr:hypothetical protein [Clostridia bacterium]
MGEPSTFFLICVSFPVIVGIVFLVARKLKWDRVKKVALTLFIIFAIFMVVATIALAAYSIWARYDLTDYSSEVHSNIYDGEDLKIYATQDGITVDATQHANKVEYFLLISAHRVWWGLDENADSIVIEFGSGAVFEVFEVDADNAIVRTEVNGKQAMYRVSYPSIWSNLERGLSETGWENKNNPIVSE